MADTATSTKPTQVTTQTAIPLSIQEYCIRLSSSDGRVELIGGFEHYAKSQGVTFATDEEFSKLYQTFIQMPI